ncbi:type II secretion system protein N [Xenophilus azovorans]|jgi:general secretion pathway protein C|uniref:type II secretion system protein N n=1 Tax=Xenophilus TaxID=151754 RepID=UPI00068926EF|nr:type II secretion system protein N [Xenophilus azovorans]
MTQAHAPTRWPAAATTVLVWAAAAASLVFWGLRLASPADGDRPPAVSATPAMSIDTQAVARALGAQPAVAQAVRVPDAASRFALLGVVADANGRGAALIAVDGKPPRPFRAGAALAQGYVLQGVDAHGVRVGAGVDAPAAFTLQVPARPGAVNGPPRPAPAMPAG